MKNNFNFKKDGFVILKNFFDKKIIENINNSFELFNKKNKKNKNENKFVVEKNNIKFIQNPQIYVEELNKIINFDLFNICKKILNENVYLQAIDYHAKAKGTSFTPPHQDNFYFCLKPANSLTAYIPLVKQNINSGAMTVLIGSHRNGVLPHFKSKTAAFSSYIDEKYLKQFNNTYTYDLSIGDLAIHHCNLVHFANENHSNSLRKSLALRLNGESAKFNKLMKNKYLKNLKFNREK